MNWEVFYPLLIFRRLCKPLVLIFLYVFDRIHKESHLGLGFFFLCGNCLNYNSITCCKFRFSTSWVSFGSFCLLGICSFHLNHQITFWHTIILVFLHNFFFYFCKIGSNVLSFIAALSNLNILSLFSWSV